MNQNNAIQKRLLASNIKVSTVLGDHRNIITNYILLGDIYANAAVVHQFTRWTDIVYAAGLWNYGLDIALQLHITRLQPLITRRLAQLKDQFIKAKIPASERNLYLELNKNLNWPNRLITIRHSIRQRLETSSVNQTRGLYKQISKDMHALFHDMLQQSIQLINPNLNSNDYCIIIAGSFKKHGTSFSDIEFAVLIRNEALRQQIYSIITLLFVHILELRETPIRALCIAELDFLYHDFDHSMKAGLRFDGGKSRLYPLPVMDVCSQEGLFSLVQTPEKMVELMQAHAHCTRHMLTINFIQPSFLMGNKGLYFRYLNLIQYQFSSISPTIKTLGLNQTVLDLDRYNPELQEMYIFKHEIYGVLNLFKSLKLMLGLASDDYWDQLTELYNKKIISHQALIQLTRFINWIQYHRIKLYSTNHGQHDKMPVMLNHTIENKYKHKPHVHYFLQDIHGLLFVYYATAFNFNHAVRIFLAHRQDKIHLSPKQPYSTILPFITSYLTRDNTTNTKKKHHQLYDKIGNQMIQDNAKDLLHNNNMIVLSIRVLTCIANCQMQSAAPTFAYLLIESGERILKLLFTRNQNAVYKKAVYRNGANQSELLAYELATLLCTFDPRLPTLVATLLYLKARCYFYGVHHVSPDLSFQLTIIACALRRWIDQHQAMCDDTWNEHGGDSYTFIRSSLLYHLTDRAKTEYDLLNVVEEYNQLLLINDNIHRMECHHKLTRVYLKLQKNTQNPHYAQQANVHFNHVERLSNQSTEFSSQVKFDKTRKQLKQLPTYSPAFFGCSQWTNTDEAYVVLTGRYCSLDCGQTTGS
ncbi:MAG: hypothetical protein Q8R24_04095 [Legionellaceae bacterium]|nr:hypothetical protein [Legionellaceae bacterium]